MTMRLLTELNSNAPHYDIDGKAYVHQLFAQAAHHDTPSR